MIEIAPPAADRACLPGADFADGYRLGGRAPITPRAAATLMLARPSPAMRRLLAFRNAVVAPFGLKTALSPPGDAPAIGFFPLVGQSDERVVLGLDDRHLDFRLVVAVRSVAEAAGGEAGAESEVDVISVVRTKNGFGRAYLRAVRPFHRWIVPAMMRRLPASLRS